MKEPGIEEWIKEQKERKAKGFNYYDIKFKQKKIINALSSGSSSHNISNIINEPYNAFQVINSYKNKKYIAFGIYFL